MNCTAEIVSANVVDFLKYQMLCFGLHFVGREMPQIG